MQIQPQQEAAPHVREGLGTVRPYRDTRMPTTLRIPRPLQAIAGGSITAGMLAGLLRGHSSASRLLRMIFYGSTAAYLVAALLDLAEHFRLEKEVTGHYLRWVAVPPSETAVHAGIIGTNLSVLALTRRFRKPKTMRDYWLLVAPGIFLTLGWIDELVYHRRRAPHREDIMHTTEHLAEGIMWTTLYATRLIRWD